MSRPFDIKRLLKDKEALLARLELALALERPKRMLSPPPPASPPKQP